MKKNKFLYILPIALGLVACEPEFDDIDFNGGSADFSNFVSVGNSLTAGFQSNALRREKQEVSMSAMIAGQLQQIGSGSFKQPLMDPGAGLGSAGNAEFGLFIRQGCDPTSSPSPTPAPIAPIGQVDQLNPSNFVGADGPFNNVSVPGAKSFHLLAPGYGDPTGISMGTANPFYARFCNPMDFQETLLAAAMRANPTFFSLWIGNNDVLGYATSGGNNPNEQITDPATFAGVYNQLISTLTSNGAKGVVANIPDITSIPFFTTVPIGTDQISADQAAQLNMAYAQYNGGLDQAAAGNPAFAPEAEMRKINFVGGQLNTFVVTDDALTAIPGLPNLRQIKAGELLTLTTSGDSLSCFGLGTAIPINPSNHLTAVEISNISNAVSAYNMAIKAAANANGLAFVDANSRLKELASSGITIEGTTYNAEFVSGGAFSLDGVHPSTKGYAIIANDFIKAINSKYAANIPQVSVGSYQNIEIVN